MAESTAQDSERQVSKLLTNYWRSIKRNWLVELAVILACVLLAFGWTFTQTKMYTSRSVAVIKAGDDDNLALSVMADSYAKSKATQLKELALSREVASLAAEKAQVSDSPEALLGRVTVANPLDTTQLNISVSAESPSKAESLANAWITALAEQNKKIDDAGKKTTSSATEGSSGSAPQVTSGFVRVVPLASATRPTSPSSPNVKMAIAAGFGAGLILALIYAYIRTLVDRQIRSSDVIEKEFGLAVVGTIPDSENLSGDKRLVSSDASDTRANFAVIESFKELRTNIQFMNPDHPPRVLTITSSLPSEGKSTVADNIALTIAQSRPVYLVDCDMRRPTVAKTFGLIEKVGLTNLLVGNATIDEVTQYVHEQPNLRVIAAGTTPPNPSELLSSDRMVQVVNELSQHGMVILDAPPLLAVTDAAILATRFDGAIVVVTAGRTRKDELEKAISNLDRVKAKKLGVVLNRVPQTKSESRYYAYYGKEYYYSRDENTEAASADPSGRPADKKTDSA